MKVTWQEARQISGEIVSILQEEEAIVLNRIGKSDAVEKIAQIIFDKDAHEWLPRRQEWSP